VVNSLAGKVPGLFIQNGSGVGSSAKVLLRGNKSTSNSQPLYVIDGIPMTNRNTGEQGGVFGGGIDAGDGISNINPEDIASMSILKGASAAALYGSQAANGVILITTKKGAAGKPKINFSTTYTTEKAAFIPEMQYKYGQTSDGALASWGPEVNAPNHVDGFFQTGTNFTNSISVSGGTDNTQSYFSYSNTSSEGIVPTNELKRHNFNFNQTASFFDNKLTLNGSANFINQITDNRVAGGLYFNPLTGLYQFPRGQNFDDFADNYEVFSAARNINVQNWLADSDTQQNPYWILNRNKNKNKRNRVISALSAKYQLTSWLNIQARGNIDKTIDNFDHKIFATTQGTLSDPNGRYVLRNTDEQQIYGDIILGMNKNLTESLTFDFNLGTSHTKNIFYGLFADSKGGDLAFANEFGLQGMKNPVAAGTRLEEQLTRVKRNAVFASAQFGLSNTYYLDLTARNDWSSALPTESYFYPSVGASIVLSELMEIEALSFGKLRASYAIVGNDVPAYLTNSRDDRGRIINGQLSLSKEGPIPGTTLVPEESRSFEVGLDLRFLQDKLTLDFTYYRTNTKNQFINISAPAGSGFERYLVNAGDIQNSGIEAALGYKLVNTPDFQWTGFLNFTRNVNEVIEVHPEFDKSEDGIFFITNEAVNSYQMGLKKGGSFGDIYGAQFARNEAGQILIDAEGKPMRDAAFGLLGNANPDFMLGLSNEFSYKGVSLRLLIDGRFGGEVMSITEAVLDLNGVSQRSSDARDAGGVAINGVSDADGTPVTTVDAELYYNAVGGRNSITENYIYDATNIRLRELSLGYSLPKSVMQNIGFVESVKLSIVGRNLFFFQNEAPFDPDVTFSTGVGLQGLDIFSLPSTRTLGFSLGLVF
jgi:TonB-linked SusC/RagA family outer membrane protein